MNAICATLAGSLLNVALQGALLTTAVALALRLVLTISATVRSVVWSAAFLLLLVLHFVSRSPVASTHHASPVLGVWIVGVWLAASIWRIVQFSAAVVRLRSLYHRALPLGETIAVSGGTSALLCASQDVSRPTVAGFLQPRILLPEAMLGDLTSEERRYVLLHETTHLRRADHWTNLLQKLALIVFPLDPALLWIERRLCREREFACDERVIAETHAPRAYAMCLTSLAERGMFARASSLALGAWHRRSELVERVEKMLMPAHTPAPHVQNAAVGTLLCTTLFAGALAIARQPQIFSFVPAVLPVVAGSVDDAMPTAGARMVLTSATLPQRSGAAAFQTSSNRKQGSPARTPMLRQTLRRIPGHRIAQYQSTLYLTKQLHRQRVPALPAGFLRTGTFLHSSSPVFVPVTTYAVATPEGWLVITI